MERQDLGLKEAISNSKLIVFDVDGTLTDSVGQIITCFQRTFEKAQLPIPTPEAIKATIGLTLQLGIQTVLPDPNDEKLAEEITKLYRQTFIESPDINATIMFDGAIETLEFVKAHGKKTAIATGRSSLGIERLFNDVKGLSNLFDAVCTGDMCASKPNKEMMEILSKRCDVSLEETIGIGDAVIDMQLFANAKAKSIAVLSGVDKFETLKEAHANFILPKVSDIKDYFA